jgi:hypothetical protein
VLAQHADSSPEIQRELHASLTDAVERGEASPGDLAYLEDRVRVNAGHPQLYGTQFFDDGQCLRPHPIEHPDGLAERRASAGLEPFEQYEATMRGLENEKS